MLSRFNFFKLLVLAKELGGPEHFLDELDEEKMKGLEEKIKGKYDIDLHLVTALKGQRSAVEKQKSAVNKARDISASLREKGFAVKLNERGKVRSPIYKIESQAFGTVLFTTGGFPGGIDAIRGLFGPEALYVIYNAEHKAEHKNVFISTAGQKLPPELLDIGFVLREKMGIVPPGEENFYSMGELLEILNISEEEIEKNHFLRDAVKAEEVDEKWLERVAQDFFTDFLKQLKKGGASDDLLRQKIGDRLFALLSGDIENYLKYVTQKKKLKNAGDPPTIQWLKEKNLPKLKDWLVKEYKKRGGKGEEDLMEKLGPAGDDLFGK